MGVSRIEQAQAGVLPLASQPPCRSLSALWGQDGADGEAVAVLVVESQRNVGWAKRQHAYHESRNADGTAGTLRFAHPTHRERCYGFFVTHRHCEERERRSNPD